MLRTRRRFHYHQQRRDGNEGEEKGEGERRNEAKRRKSEEEKEKEKKFTDEGVHIAYPDDYVGTSTIIVTPDGITMHPGQVEGRSSVGSVSIACNRR